MQVTLGNRQSTVVSVDSTNLVNIGQWVAIFCEDAVDPCIGKIKEMKNEDILVKWYKGKWNGQWQEWLLPISGKSHKQTEWLDWVKKESIILYDFQMTSTNRLKKETVSYLKKKYSELREH